MNIKTRRTIAKAGVVLFASTLATCASMRAYQVYHHNDTSSLSQTEYAEVENEKSNSNIKYMKADVTYIDNSIIEEDNAIIEEQNDKIETQNEQIEFEIEKPKLQSDDEWTYAEIVSSTKTYGDWSCITNQNSAQWQLLHGGTVAVCSDGMLRDSQGYICAALGSYFGAVGSRWVFLTDTGIEIPIIKCDEKQDAHTIDSLHTVGINYDIIEFYIDTATHRANGNVWANGYVYSGNFNNCADYNGTIIAWKQVG